MGYSPEKDSEPQEPKCVAGAWGPGLRARGQKCQSSEVLSPWFLPGWPGLPGKKVHVCAGRL